MNLVATRRKDLKKLIEDNILELHEYFRNQRQYRFVKNMDTVLFKKQLIQWVFNVRKYVKKYSNSRFYLVEILGEYVKIENIKNKYHIQ